MKLYSVVNMDIVASRKVKDRQQLQNNLNNYINLMNKKYADILVAPITITLGDEWQLIINKPSESYSIIHEFQQMLWKDNVEIYAGIGIGGISTSIFDDVRKMDGPCFHTAREAIKTIKNVDKLKNKYSINKLNKVFFLTPSMSDNNTEIDVLDFYYNLKTSYTESILQEIAVTKEPDCNYLNDSISINKIFLERTINLLIENNEILKAKMTEKQREIYINYIRLGSYRKVVEVLEGTIKETIGGISQKLNSASYFTIQRNHQVVSILLDTYRSMGV